MFENIIGKISKTLAAIVVFFLAANVYLSAKGFEWVDGKLVLVSEANAEDGDAELALNKYEGLTEGKPSGFDPIGARTLGNDAAKVTLYELSSLGCSHCADFHLNILPEFKKEYVDTGKVKVVFADFPLDQKSMKAAMLARCMPQDKYFDFLGLLFKKQMSWGMSFKTEKLLAGYAEMEGLSQEKAEECMKDDKIASDLMYIRQQGMEKLGVQGTPYFLVKAGDKEQVIEGAPSYDRLKAIIDSFL